MSVSTVSFRACGKVQKLRLTTRAGVELEDRFDKTIVELVRELEQGFGFRLMLAFFVASLDSGKGVDEAQASAVIDDLGGLAQAGNELSKMINLAFPTVAEDEEADGETAGAPPAGNAKGKGA